MLYICEDKILKVYFIGTKAKGNKNSRHERNVFLEGMNFFFFEGMKEMLTIVPKHPLRILNGYTHENLCITLKIKMFDFY